MLISNLIIGSNEATTLAGSSFGLSFPADKERMQIIRGQAGAILVGGNTYRSEPYQRLEKPVLVASSQTDSLPRPLLGEILPLSPVELAEYALAKYPSPILIEGGRDFLVPLLKARKINKMYLTISKIAGDDRFIKYQEITSGMNLQERLCNSEGTFEIWNLLSD